MAIHEECGVFGVYDPQGGCAAARIMGFTPYSTAARRPAVLR